ncbi:hypothetical protein [Streptomyces triculaminicus]|uniref:hypothetical protein n=1 Tax=Streptomyces triculaminicus TaxID=2816232 RepID=UPI0037D689E2
MAPRIAATAWHFAPVDACLAQPADRVDRAVRPHHPAGTLTHGTGHAPGRR